MTAPGPAEPKPPALPQAPAAPPALPVPTPPANLPAVRVAAAPTPPKSGSGAAAGAYLLSIVALIIAVAAGAGAAYAYKIAQEARDANANAAPGLTQSPSDTPTAPASPSAAASPSTTATPGPVYIPEFERAERPVPLPLGCNAAYVDVDTLAVGTALGHEFYLALRPCDESPNDLVVRVDRTSGRSVSAANPSPATCGSLVAGTPTSELVLDVEPGLTFCLLTNRTDATTQSLPQRLAIVEVVSVSETLVVLAISTYRIG